MYKSYQTCSSGQYKYSEIASIVSHKHTLKFGEPDTEGHFPDVLKPFLSAYDDLYYIVYMSSLSTTLKYSEGFVFSYWENSSKLTNEANLHRKKKFSLHNFSKWW